jgi:hypothetical protein
MGPLLQTPSCAGSVRELRRREMRANALTRSEGANLQRRGQHLQQSQLRPNGNAG